MYKVCIVDDEALIQNSIVMRLRETKLPMQVEGCAADGEAALALYRRVRPDIFFVDINMPGMTGLEFIRRVRAEDPECAAKFIIISGYDDFRHVQEAIKIGVMDYITKPISTEEFGEVVASAARMLQKERSAVREQGGAYYDEYILRPGALQTVAGGTLLAVLGSGPFAEGDLARAIEAMPGGEPLCLLFKGAPGLRLYLAPGRAEAAELERLCGGLPGAIGVYAHPGGESLARLIELAEQTLNLRFVRRDFRFAACVAGGAKAGGDMEMLDYALESGRADDCRRIVEGYLQSLTADGEAALGISPLYRQVISLVINKYVQRYMQIPEAIKNEFSHFALCRFATLEELTGHLCALTEALAEAIRRAGHGSELIESVCTYIGQNYRENLTLGDVAGHFYITPPYLSRRFKEKTGVTFVQYLESIRMERAREYLERSEAQIVDISARVGYADPNYFAKVFKKKYNISPSDYRSRMENNAKPS